MPAEMEGRYAATGINELARDRLIWQLHQAGWSLRQIGAHPQVAMSHVSVKFRLDKLAGIARRRNPTCRGCGRGVPTGELIDGFCEECVEEYV